MRLVVNKKACLKSGQCTYLHPNVFATGEDGYPVVLVPNPEGAQLMEADDAAEVCPSQAIQLLEDNGAA